MAIRIDALCRARRSCTVTVGIRASAAIAVAFDKVNDASVVCGLTVEIH